MNILITSPRAPAVLDWMRVFADADETVLCDSLRFPLAAFAARRNPRVRYCRIPPPRYDFAGYAAAMRGLVAEADFVVPTCEDIFYLAHVPLPESEREKLFMPPRTLLLGLHDKWRFFDYLPRDTAVRLPHTRRLASADDIDWAAAGRSVFKPVYSRFGRRVLVSPRPDALENLHISAAEPWVQQQRIAGKPLCSYAVCERGRVAAQVVYDPMYLVNGSASTYFRRADEPRIHDFVTEFAAKNAFHGQAAFDFIDDGRGIYVIECNPRATSGIHLLAGALSYSGSLKSWQFNPERVQTNAAVSKKMWRLFAWQARREKTCREVWADYAAARDVLADISARDLALSMGELAWIAWRKGIALSDASTADIEWNGDAP